MRQRPIQPLLKALQGAYRLSPKGSGTDVTYEPSPDYCNDPGEPDDDTFTYTLTPDGTATLYLDGEPRAAHEVGGDLSPWDAGFNLGLANEFSNDRPWVGTLHLVAAAGSG